MVLMQWCVKETKGRLIGHMRTHARTHTRTAHHSTNTHARTCMHAQVGQKNEEELQQLPGKPVSGRHCGGKAGGGLQAALVCAVGMDCWPFGPLLSSRTTRQLSFIAYRYNRVP